MTEANGNAGHGAASGPNVAKPYDPAVEVNAVPTSWGVGMPGRNAFFPGPSSSRKRDYAAVYEEAPEGQPDCASAI